MTVPKTLGAVAAAGMALLVAGEAQAFCVYNFSSWDIRFTQEGERKEYLYRGFQKTVPARGGKECCNWTDGGCNPGGEQTSTVYLTTSIQNAPNNDIRNYRCDWQWSPITMQAGGWVEIYDGGGYGLVCNVYPAN